MVALLRGCRDTETRYLVRTLVQSLRVGASLATVLPALARAAVWHHAQAAQQQRTPGEASRITAASLKQELTLAEAIIKQVRGPAHARDPWVRREQVVSPRR